MKTFYVISTLTSALFTKIDKSYLLMTDSLYTRLPIEIGYSSFREFCIYSDINRLGTFVHIRTPEMYRDIQMDNGRNEVLIFVTKKQLEDSHDWFCYIAIFNDLLLQQTDCEDYKILKTKSRRTTLLFDTETYVLYHEQRNVRDVNDFVNKNGYCRLEYI